MIKPAPVPVKLRKNLPLFIARKCWKLDLEKFVLKKWVPVPVPVEPEPLKNVSFFSFRLRLEKNLGSEATVRTLYGFNCTSTGADSNINKLTRNYYL
jgi:hypothetical protein